jgi:hypothetical protein
VVGNREKEIGGSGDSLEPPGPLLTHLHTVYMAYFECLPTGLTPLAERTCFSQFGKVLLFDDSFEHEVWYDAPAGRGARGTCINF